MLIGLMGKSGTGKTTISLLFKELNPNINIIEIDKIGHKSHQNHDIKKQLIYYFGKEILNQDGTINKSKLANIVYHDKDMMQQLYNITSNFMENEIEKEIKKDTINILDYALLPKLKIYEKCDLKILVTSPYSVRCSRVMKREHISKSKYYARDLNSIDYSYLTVDYKIINNGNLPYLRKVIGEIYEKSILSRKF